MRKSWLKLGKKKLSAAKKAWKQMFTYILKSKPHRLRNSKAFKTTNNIPITAAHFIQLGQEGQMGFAAIHVETLYEEAAGAMVQTKQEEAEDEGCRYGRMRMEEEENKAKMAESMDDDDGSDDEESTYTSPQQELHEVDAKAEEFINKFRQQLRLQREKSIEDFHEMLSRSA